MTMLPAPTRALLIGIDHYRPNRATHGSRYGQLRGAVGDVERMARLLTERFGVPVANLDVLTAPQAIHLVPGPRRPSYEAIVEAWKRLVATARPGEQILIHVSAHGGRVRTAYPEIKGSDATDEAIVPWNVGDPAGRYLRDVEIAYLVEQLRATGAFLTLILDCCHAGGAMRGNGLPAHATIRGGFARDERAGHRSMLPREACLHAWRKLGGRAEQSDADIGWLPPPRGYIMMAACRASECAIETVFEAGAVEGALSRAVRKTLEASDAQLTYRRLFARVRAEVYGVFQQQIPQIEGEDNRIVFGAEHREEPRCVDVLHVAPDHRRVVLDTGTAQGVRAGARFTVHPWRARILERHHKEAIEIEVTVSSTNASYGEVVGTPTSTVGLEPGGQAILSSVLSHSLRQKVWLDPSLPARFARAVDDQPSGLLHRIDDREEAIFSVRPIKHDRIKVETQTDVLRTSHPPLSAEDSDRNAATLAHWLHHLVRYCQVWTLSNDDTAAQLAGALDVALLNASGKPLPCEKADGAPTLPADTPIRLRIRNRCDWALYIAVLDLAADWSINQLWPPILRVLPENMFLPGVTRVLSLETTLPSGMDEGWARLLVIATRDVTTNHWLTLDPFEGQTTRSDADRDLHQALACALLGEETPRRDFELIINPSDQWTTAAVDLHIERAPSAPCRNET